MGLKAKVRNAILKSAPVQKFLNRKVKPAPLVVPCTVPYSQKAFAYYIENIPTDTTSVYEQSCLFTLASVTKGNIVELGTYIGKSASVMASAIRPESGRKLITIDLFTRERGETGSRESYLFKDKSQMEIVTKALADLKLSNTVKVYKGSTYDLAPTLSDLTDIDLIFIDASHHYEDVKKDIAAFLPHVNSGGYVAFHDYNSKIWPDVKRAVDEFLNGNKGYQVEFLVDSMLICKKL